MHKLGLYQPATKVAYHVSREGFRAASVAARQFKAVAKLVKPQRLPEPARKSELFDLSISEEQQMIRDMAQRFAKEVMREHAAKARSRRAAAPEGFAKMFGELGLAQFTVPESLGGAAAESSTVTQVLVAEDLAYGDMGLAVAALAPIGVGERARALGLGRSAGEVSRAVRGRAPPVAALAVTEARPAFDPRELRTRARQDGDGFILSGEKTLVPLAETAELLLVAADLLGRGPQLFLVEASRRASRSRPTRAWACARRAWAACASTT